MEEIQHTQIETPKDPKKDQKSPDLQAETPNAETQDNKKKDPQPLPE
jgi:hypothetical protein